MIDRNDDNTQVAQFWASIDADDDPADQHIADEDIYDD